MAALSGRQPSSVANQLIASGWLLLQFATGVPVSSLLAAYAQRRTETKNPAQKYIHSPQKEPTQSHPKHMLTSTTATASSSAASGSSIDSSASGAGPAKVPKKPKSVKPFQLTQLQKTLSRRKQHLDRLTEEELQTVLDLVIETLYGSDGGGKKPAAGSNSSGNGGRLAEVIESLPHANDELRNKSRNDTAAAATVHSKLKENVVFGLTAAFYASINDELTKGQRNAALRSVKTILGGIDASRKDAVERNLRKEKERRDQEQANKKAAKAKEKERAQQNESAGEKQATSNIAETSAVTGGSSASADLASGSTDKERDSSNMGSLLSTGRDANANDHDDSDDEVVILDGPPSPPPAGRKDKPLPKPKQEADDNSDAKSNGDPPAAAASALPAVPVRPRHRQVKSAAAIPQTMTVLADTSKPRYSASIHPRPKAQLTFDGSIDPQRGTIIDEVTLDDVRSRMAKWDPYWDVVHEFSSGLSNGLVPTDLEWGKRTGPVSAYRELGKRTGDMKNAEKYEIVTAGAVKVHVDPNDVGLRAKLNAGKGGVMKWGKSASPAPSRYSTGDRRCILRMLPLYATDAERTKQRKKRADTHLWPIGTFVQYNNRALTIIQRKQQSHDHTEWKGMSHALDVTELVSDIYSVSLPNTIEIATRDETPYAIHLAVCDFVGPDALYDRLMARNGPQSILKYDYDEALKVALDYVKNQMVVLDSDSEDDGDDPGGHEGSSQQYSLLCPLSMSVMQTPVRGKGCRHIACFDLRNWLHNNVTVGGTRWRCGHCENFLAPSDLLVDGMFCRFLEQTQGQISSARDKVQLNPDGTWELMDANKLRYQNNKRGSGELGDSNGNALKRSKIEPGAPSPVPNGGGGEQEIIELDDSD